MIGFSWKGFNVGDKVKVFAGLSDLTEIGLDESYLNAEGVIAKTTREVSNVCFGSETLQFYNNMLCKVDNTYNDESDVEEYSEEYIQAMNKEYGEV